MRRILILVSLLLWPQQPQPCKQTWRYEIIGVQMPKDTKPITNLVLYSKPTPDSRPPVCTVDFGEAQFSNVNAAYAVLDGKQNSLVKFHCTERP